MTSPCSVKRMAPVRAAGGAERIARPARPPPRPTVPPRPWKKRTVQPWFAAASPICCCAVWSAAFAARNPPSLLESE